MIQLLLSPFLGHCYSQGCDGSLEAQEELSSGFCFLIAARRRSSCWHCCTGHSWFHLVFDLTHGLAFIFLSRNVLFHFLWEEETSPFLYAEESDISLLNPVCLQIASKMDFKERKVPSVSAKSIGSVKKGKSLHWRCCQMN